MDLQPSIFIKCKGDLTLLDGASPILFGSAISIQVWLRLSPFEVVLGYRLGMTRDEKVIPARRRE